MREQGVERTQRCSTRRNPVTNRILVYIEDLNADLARAFPGVVVGVDPASPRVRALMYTDDIALFAASEEDLHRALAVLDTWASKWRMTFRIGAEKSVVMAFFAANRSGNSPFTLSARQLPWVSQYRYLDVHVDQRLTLRPLIQHLRDLAHALFWQVCGWARSRFHYHACCY